MTQLSILQAGRLTDSFKETIENHVKSLGCDPVWAVFDGDELSLDTVKPFDLAFLSQHFCLQASEFVHHFSVGSHFLKYADILYWDAGQLWGAGLVEEALAQVFRHNLSIHRKNESVLFVGTGSSFWPIVRTLSQFGCHDFRVLEVGQSIEFDSDFLRKIGLFQLNLSTIESETFLESQHEYGLCFVMEDQYPQESLEDMSYFHFLSNQSLVFDFSGHSNFAFSDLEQLGVKVVSFKENELARVELAKDHLSKIIEKKHLTSP